MIETAALIIDGSPSARFAIGRLLTDLGCPADSSNSLNEAVQYLQTRRPQLVFVDDRLLAADAFSQLRALPALAAAVIVICMVEDDPSLAERWRSRGAAGLLIKPPTREQLASLLADLLPERPLIDAAPWTAAKFAPQTLSDKPVASTEATEQRTRDLEEQVAKLDALPASTPLTLASEELDLSIEGRLSRLEQRLLDLEQHLDAHRQAMIEEARAVAEHTVMAAAESISDRLAESILKTLGKT